jgi:hypothetical protein
MVLPIKIGEVEKKLNTGGIMPLTIKQINKKIKSIEVYYNNLKIMSYEYDLKDKMYLGRLYKLKLKLLKQKKGNNEKN